ncbi:uncharacterized protein DUF2788 [Fluviicoccus keumensis]|uniref:Uncharacterized protein DUF2788 n=1 Tax=Fluviicoccus keumensis TaxID=1435465 RepID=A0A4Q7ZAN4_9GAMM|nr:DUF2788 domain-containing protein [Fluviicoccus keumensis]RZU46963.1 uncharacterized protein DUF2788 [Fluviicoccus keumensis]
MTDEMLTQLGMNLAVPAFIAFLMFVIWDLAKKSNAGKMGTFALFIALGVGFLGYTIKIVLQFVINK